jgi:hypothetical protein
MRNIHRNTLLSTFALVAGCAFVTGANAQMRTAKACASVDLDLNMPIELASPGNICYSGFRCAVGMRGDWMDVTDEVAIAPLRGGSGLAAAGYVQSRGTQNGTYVDWRTPDLYCIPLAVKNREGFVGITIRELTGHGRLRVTALRPGPMGVGRHSDHYDVEVRDGSRYLEMYPRSAPTARVGQTRIIEIPGRGLQSLRLKLQPVAQAYTTTSAARAPRMAAAAAVVRAQVSTKPSAATLGNAATVRALSSSGNASVQPLSAPSTAAPSPEVKLLGATQLMVRLQVKFDRQGIFSLGDYLEFANGEPDLNRDLGWPLIDVKP